MKSTLMEAGYSPGLIGRITAAHADYYHRHWGFDVRFEAQVASELADFVTGLGRNGLWAARREGRLAGSIAIDGRTAEAAGARLRWFLVDPEFQRSGIGAALLDCALTFCVRKGYRVVNLWTFAGLSAARRLYEKNGFVLEEEHEAAPWGPTIREQKFSAHL